MLCFLQYVRVVDVWWAPSKDWPAFLFGFRLLEFFVVLVFCVSRHRIFFLSHSSSSIISSTSSFVYFDSVASIRGAVMGRIEVRKRNVFQERALYLLKRVARWIVGVYFRWILLRRSLTTN
jgi:hypothetical protein